MNTKEHYIKHKKLYIKDTDERHKRTAQNSLTKEHCRGTSHEYRKGTSQSNITEERHKSITKEHHRDITKGRLSL